MSSSFPDSRYVVEGPEGFLAFSEDGGIHWGPLMGAWCFRTMCRATMVLYELGLANHGLYRVMTVNLPARTAHQSQSQGAGPGQSPDAGSSPG
jgi:hypothetical protein